ncbi:MAG: sel1 repeat family protein [Pseudomonadales bacterium]|nr:sel1 repeat family protein [Pseudomonadales bacterium]
MQAAPDCGNAGCKDEAHIAALIDAADKDARAAYDLGLRFFRGDGVRQNSYQALQWMRKAAERGDIKAQLAVGRFYLMGLEEMGSDPAEAEKWLSIAAGRGDEEAQKLLAEAQAAKKANQQEYQRWLNVRRAGWYGYWSHGYAYRSYWRDGVWLYY